MYVYIYSGDDGGDSDTDVYATIVHFIVFLLIYNNVGAVFRCRMHAFKIANQRVVRLEAKIAFPCLIINMMVFWLHHKLRGVLTEHSLVYSFFVLPRCHCVRVVAVCVNVQMVFVCVYASCVNEVCLFVHIETSGAHVSG